MKAGVFVSAALVCAFSAGGAPGGSGAGIEAHARACNEFGFRVARTAFPGAGNFAFSPYSAFRILSALGSGAGGEASAQISSVLGAPDAPGEFFSAVDGAAAGFADSGGAAAFHGAVWTPRFAPVRAEFLKSCAKVFNILPNTYNPQLPEVSASRINSWVEWATKGAVKEAVLPSELSVPAIVVTGASCFEGRWQRIFNPADTRKGRFWMSREKFLEVPMMVSESVGAMAEFEHFDAAMLPYSGGGFSMVVLLPKDIESGAKGALGHLTGESFSNMFGVLRSMGAEKAPTVFYMPRFRVSAGKVSLKGALSKMGMPAVFSESADFGGVAEVKPGLYVSDFSQSAAVSVDESGTKAAAVDLLNMPFGPVKKFSANRPFLFCIVENGTGAVVFLGWVENPSGGGTGGSGEAVNTEPAPALG